MGRISKRLKTPSQEELLDRYAYEPETGALLHRHGRRKGLPAGSDVSRRAQVRVGCVLHSKSRIIWRMMTGEDPGELEVEHRDRNQYNQKWDNLRLATGSQNMVNTVRRIASSGHRSVYRTKWGGKYYAQIAINGESFYSPLLATLEEAIAYRDELIRKHHGEFALKDLTEKRGGA